MKYRFRDMSPRVPTLTVTDLMFLDVGGLTLNSSALWIRSQFNYRRYSAPGDCLRWRSHVRSGLPSFLDADTYGWIGPLE